MIKKIPKTAQLGTIVLLLFIVLIVSVQSTFQSYYAFYYPDQTYEKPLLFKATSKIHQLSPFQFFTSYSGFNTGYGFFAPNVASDFVFIFKVYNKKGSLVKKQDLIQFKTHESHVRFSTFQTMFLKKLNDQTDKKYNKYLDIIIEQVSLYILKQYPDGYSITTNLSLYDYPRIKEMKKGKTQPKLIEIKTYQL